MSHHMVNYMRAYILTPFLLGFQQAVENEGMPHHMYPSDRGSLFISYRVNFPPKLSEQQKKSILTIIIIELKIFISNF